MSNNKELEFIDRNEFKILIKNACIDIQKNPTKLKIISIYGTGGFGKTQVLKHCFLNEKKFRPIYIPLEITDKDNKIDILIKFRKNLPSKYFYPLFDYTIQLLWSKFYNARMNEDFLHLTNESLRSFLFYGVKTISNIDSIPIKDFLNLIGKKIEKIYAEHAIKKIMSNITNMEAHKIEDLLPVLLGIDIHRAFIDSTLILFIDSYQVYSKQLDNSISWLTNLVSQIGYGLFVITSREKITWPYKIKKNVISKELAELPESEVRSILKKYNFQVAQIDNIIKTTECIPIYLDLAIKAYDNYFFQHSEIPNIYFETKEDIVKQFFCHLPYEEREIVDKLAIIQIFNQEIFEHLVKELNLQVDILIFDTLCQRSLIKNMECDNYFLKIHDVIHKNICKITSTNILQRIFDCYIGIIHEYIVSTYTTIQINMLFKHILLLIIENHLTISVKTTEQIMDIYFVIKESMFSFSCDDIEGFSTYPPLSNIYLFIKALSEERNNSSARLKLLNKISDNTYNFGKHNKSYKLIQGYLRALCESSSYLKMVVEEINPILKEHEKNEWYYGQTKIFLGDCYVSYGKFISGINELKGYENILSKLPHKKNDTFQIKRHIAHGYRFNMLLQDAEDLYRSLIEDENAFPTPIQNVYILTNLCETCCYFKPDEVIRISEQALYLAQEMKDLKSIGKIYYSLAIVSLQKKDYQTAQSFIQKSIYCNKKDGYIAGQLYAYMARVYCEYSQYGTVSKRLLSKIQKIQNEIEVYKYFSLPIAILQNDIDNLDQIKHEYEWLNFDKTLLIYGKFFDSLR